jgi:hypothetical protein
MQDLGLHLSVIIIAQPGDLSWTQLLQDLSLLSLGSEIILVGSKPQSSIVEQVAKQSDIGENLKWIHAPHNRATQLNLALAQCKNEWIWMLNPDCRVSSQTFSALEKSVQEHPNAIHYFDLDFLEKNIKIAALNSLGSWLRSRVLTLPFANQGLCVSRETLRKVGDFDSKLSSNEDVQWIHQAKLKNIAIQAVASPLVTSNKKYDHHGWAKITLKELKNSSRKTFPSYLKYLQKKWLG